MTIALGTMTWARESDEAEARRMYSLAREHGVVWFDSASSYSDGRAEEILGRCLAADPKRNEVKISTKGGYRGEDIAQEIEGSLQRLAVERVELYLHHHWAKHGSADALGAICDAWQAGRVRSIGISNCSAWQAAGENEALLQCGQGEISALQVLYSLAKRGAETELISWAMDSRADVFAYSPLAAGLLTGKYEGTPARVNHGCPGPRLSTDARYARRFSDWHGLPQGYREIATVLGMTPAQLAVSWVESHPSGQVIPIVGARSAKQLGELLDRKPIDAATWRAVGSLFPPPQSATGRIEEDAA